MTVTTLDEHGLELYTKNMFEKIAKDIGESQYNDSELRGKIDSNEMAISILNGENAGSVKKQIDDAFNDFATKISDDNVVNTFKELVDYCSAHGSEAAELAENISSNSIAISEIAQFIGELPSGTDATTVIEYINSKITSTDLSSIINTAKQDAISTAASDATAKADKALSDANTYTDNAIETLNTKIENLDPIQQYIPIPDEKINALFS